MPFQGRALDSESIEPKALRNVTYVPWKSWGLTPTTEVLFAQGDCMSPLLEDGDIMFADEAWPIRPGDFVTFDFKYTGGRGGVKRLVEPLPPRALWDEHHLLVVEAVNEPDPFFDCELHLIERVRRVKGPTIQLEINDALAKTRAQRRAMKAKGLAMLAEDPAPHGAIQREFIGPLERLIANTSNETSEADLRQIRAIIAELRGA